jgi:hypothetical protein
VAPKAAIPKDHVDEGTLVPGSEKAYAIAVPVGFAVTSRVGKTITILGKEPTRKVVNYLKERVRDGKVLESNEHTVFQGVRIPDDPARYLEIEVVDKRFGTVISVTDVTPAPELPPATQEERYKQVGLDPQGRLLNPRTLE